MKIYTSTYDNNSQLFSLKDHGNYKLKIVGSNMWSDLFSSISATNVDWHINQKKYKSFVKLYNKLYRLHDNIDHELWIKNNSPMKYKSGYNYKFLDTDRNKLYKMLDNIIAKIKSL